MSNFSDHPGVSGVYEDDFAEAPPRTKGSGLVEALKWGSMGVFCLCLTIVMVRGMQPELTPEQIVQHETYQGEQPPRHIFNLTSIREEGKAIPTSPAGILSAGTGSNGADAALAEIAQAIEASGRKLPRAEVPAAALPVLTESPRVVVNDSGAGLSNAGQVRMLPSFSVVADNVVIYKNPSQSAPVIAAVERDDTVTVFGSDGVWAQVAANDGSGLAGYMMQSSIVELKR